MYEAHVTQPDWTLLDTLAAELDRGGSPNVDVGGVLRPGTPPCASFNSPGQASGNYGYQRAGRSKPRQGEGSAGRERPADKSGRGAANDSDAVVKSSAVIGLEAGLELEAVKHAYPGAKEWRQGASHWLVVDADLFDNSSVRVRFIVGVSEKLRLIKAWGFWHRPLGRLEWIGPRHTNGDGSICAFDVRDQSWQYGNPLTNLIDIYTVWAFRHYHAEVRGYWPGKQSSIHGRMGGAERLIEMNPREDCACDNPRGSYAQCCMQDDMKAALSAHVNYQLYLASRRAPADIQAFANSLQIPLPTDSHLHWN